MVFDRSPSRVLCLPRGRAAATLLATALLAAALGGCGRRGPLEPPPDASVPSPTGDDGPQAGLRRPRTQPIRPPHDAFVLDPLL